MSRSVQVYTYLYIDVDVNIKMKKKYKINLNVGGMRRGLVIFNTPNLARLSVTMIPPTIRFSLTGTL